VPLSEINFEEVLVREGDLPSTITAGQIRDDPPNEDFLTEIPTPDRTIYRQLDSSETNVQGGVTIFVYESEDDARTAFEVIDASLEARDYFDPPSSVPDTGNEAVVQGGIDIFRSVPDSFFVFRRCNAVVHIEMRGGDDEESAGYAGRLDQRLEPLVCR
jgi:hypothetical protein